MRYRAGHNTRLRNGRDISRVFQEGSRAGNRRVLLLAAPNLDDAAALPRLAVAVSRRHGSAVRRNRLKRLCREAFRLVRPDLPAGWDYVLLPRPGGELTRDELLADLPALARKAVSARPSRRAGSAGPKGQT